MKGRQRRQRISLINFNPSPSPSPHRGEGCVPQGERGFFYVSSCFPSLDGRGLRGGWERKGLVYQKNCRMINKQVVITGIGVISALGLNKDEFWNGLINGRCGITEIDLFDVTNYRTKTGGADKRL